MLADEKLKTARGVEVVLWPQTIIDLTQGSGEDLGHTWLSHEGTWALDNVDWENRKIYAPVTMRCMGKYSIDSGNEVIWESVDEVLFADGSIDTLTLDFWHDDDISHLSVGDVVKQGEHAQTAGSSGAATAVHMHVEAGRGKLKLTPGKSPLIPSTGWTHYPNGHNVHPYTLPNAVDPRHVFFMNGTQVMNTFGMSFKFYETNSGWKWDPQLGEQTYYRDGRMVKDEWIWDRDYQSWYYIKPDGRMARNYWVMNNKKWCYLKVSGKMAKNEELTWYFNNSGYGELR